MTATVALGAAAALLAPLGLTAPATAEPTYAPLPQDATRIIEADSAEADQPPENVLDGDAGTIWHTAWRGGKDPLPHHLSVQVSEEPVEVARVRLQPRADSHGSGRIGDYEIHTSLAADCADDAYSVVATGGFGGSLAEATTERTITLDSPVDATCLKVVWLSSWGGRAEDPETSPPEEVASLAELNVDVIGEETDPDPIVVTPPEGTVEISDGTLQVRLHPDFPQVVDYTLDGASLAGRYGSAHTSVTIDDVSYEVETSAPEISEDGAEATYHLTVPELSGVSFDAVLSVSEGTFTWRLTNFVDPDGVVHRISVPRLDLASANGTQDGAQLTAADLSVDRGRSGDHFYDLASQEPGTSVSDPTHVALITGGELAAGFETNAVEDNTAGGETAARVQGDNSRYIVSLAPGEGATYGTVSPGTFVVRGSTADLGLGPDADPFVRVRPVADGNDDDAITWQDAAIAAREVATSINGAENVPDDVIKRIPFNIVSQATHPFLRTLDDTKRVALATDSLGQSVMLKGYQAEGHDSAHPDYADHYNLRAGGKEDLDTLVTEGEEWNATFGVHVNATESYSEAHAFSEELLQDPIRPGWNWMNQSYRIDGPKDLGSTAVLDRSQSFRDEAPENLSFLYMDVYYPNGWEGQRLAQELEAQGWVVSTEWANKMPRSSIWSHWANDENYGGSTNKGVNSQVIRFIDNDRKDVWNPDPLLSNANVQEFEGWSGQHDADAFFDMVWERNLPTKYMQQAPIMQWQDGRVVLADGTVATSEVDSIGGDEIPTDRTITSGGATVYEDGKYLLPWDDGEKRLYHWNPEGGTSTWQLTPQWASQGSLVMYRLTDTGRTDRVTVPVIDGAVTIEAEAGSAYVLHPTGSVPELPQPQWGQGTPVTDPGFFSGTLDAWSPEGQVTIETDGNRNLLATIGAGEGGISQELHDAEDPSAPLPEGSYSAWAWVEIDPSATREVTVAASGEGVVPSAHQAGQDAVSEEPAPGSNGKGKGHEKGKGKGHDKHGDEPSDGSEEGIAATTVSTSTAINATASDDKHRQHYQRVRVTFSTDGSPVTFSVTAGEGDAPVKVDDVRVVPFVEPEDPAPTEQTVLFEDFEHVETGYWPFVTGSAGLGGDARTQLAELHEPYSQAGWYGPDASGDVVEGGKLLDNVLDGSWSLMAHQENRGLILRTTEASLPLQEGHRYRVSFAHQTAFEDSYRLVIGGDTVAADPDGDPGSSVLEQIAIPQARGTDQEFSHEFTVGSCHDMTWIGIENTGGGAQNDLIMDNLRVEDLGEAQDQPACATVDVSAAAGTATIGEPTEVTTTLTNDEDEAIADIEHELDVPEGWTAELVDPGASELAPGDSTSATWQVTTTEETPRGEVTATVRYTVAGSPRSGSGAATVVSLPEGQMFLYDMQERVVGEPANGWGPVEWDQSNGEQAAGDGNPLTLNGVVHPKGIGVHASSEITVELPGACTEFSAVVGVDDEISSAAASIRFTVLGDGEVLAGPTPILGAGDDGVPLTADLTGVQELTLVVDDGGDGNGSDHGDWADARITCGG
ncbi:endo-alpha-N-acetylgalactosaminidase family protein [Brachybacterium vulturis]|uniref:endo-alpha-N-acetylgalactosaminidase family protein n=1 Tax=Brachybacterium vulturis TaxID=2017484 RepID=UPI003735BE48